MDKIIGIAALMALAGAANGQVVISEVLGATEQSDWEFIELINLGGSAVDISGYKVELWDSDSGSTFGGADGTAPYTVAAGTILQPGQAWVIGNTFARNGEVGFNDDGYDDVFGIEGYPSTMYFFNQSFGANAIENSAYTVVLADAGNAAIDSWYFDDNSGINTPNRAGVAITPGFIAPLGIQGSSSVLAPGAYRSGNSLFLLNFLQDELNDGTFAGGTPGHNQIPAPGALAIAGVAGLAASRRRRA